MATASAAKKAETNEAETNEGGPTASEVSVEQAEQDQENENLNALADASPAVQKEILDTAGAEGVGDENLWRGEGPDGTPAPTKAEKDVLLAGVTAPEVTSVNPPLYTDLELQHRLSHVPYPGYQEPVFPHPQP